MYKSYRLVSWVTDSVKKMDSVNKGRWKMPSTTTVVRNVVKLSSFEYVHILDLQCPFQAYARDTCGQENTMNSVPAH